MNETRTTVYELLADKMLDFRDYLDIAVDAHEDEAPFLPVRPSPVLNVDHQNQDMIPYTGEKILLRETVLDRLFWAGQELRNHDPAFRLELVYGYRTLEVQQQLFEAAKAELAPHFDDEERLLSATHRKIAVPEVSGHPTGGAVDVHILRDGEPVDMGTSVWDFSDDSFTFSPFISAESWSNRQLLRRVMISAGFAPFDGEWWHFSYGDKEWAAYYNKPRALFSQVGHRSLDSRPDLAGILSKPV